MQGQFDRPRAYVGSLASRSFTMTLGPTPSYASDPRIHSTVPTGSCVCHLLPSYFPVCDSRVLCNSRSVLLSLAAAFPQTGSTLSTLLGMSAVSPTDGERSSLPTTARFISCSSWSVIVRSKYRTLLSHYGARFCAQVSNTKPYPNCILERSRHVS